MKDTSDQEPDLDQAAEMLTGKKRPKDYVGGLVGDSEEEKIEGDKD